MTTPTIQWTRKAPADEARDNAEFAWRSHAEFHGIRDAVLTLWDATTAPDGRPMLSGRVDGADALAALRSFGGSAPLILGCPGDQRPGMDYSEPGRIACVWRSRDVWVRLWAPEQHAGRAA
ncbi:hypothetical protein ACWY4P_53600 (plasmid) [Streptomyces sp. LZ34]